MTELNLKKAAAAGALSPAARAAHRWILRTFAETGRAPARADLDRTVRDHVSELVELDVLAVDEHGEIRAAYPFSPIPTRHRVTWDDGPAGYALCAIDALGMSAMLGVPVTITSTEPSTGRTVVVRVDGDTACWEPTTTVVFAGRTGVDCCPSVDSTCGHINFFTTPAAAHDWATRNPGVTGTVLDQDQALAAGIGEFGALLR